MNILLVILCKCQQLNTHTHSFTVQKTADVYCITNGKRYHFLYDSLIFRFYGQQDERKNNRKEKKNEMEEKINTHTEKSGQRFDVAYAKAQWPI